MQKRMMFFIATVMVCLMVLALSVSAAGEPEGAETSWETEKNETTMPESSPETLPLEEDIKYVGDTSSLSMDWQVYIEEKLVPAVVLVVTAICSIYIAISPILVKVRTASEKFKDATADVRGTVEAGEKNTKSIEAFSASAKENMDTLREEVDRRLQEVEEMVNGVSRSANNIESIVRIAFGNMSELVMGGYARQIARVGEESEVNEEDGSEEKEA